jgi:methyltransferase (TIGR00027 family)
MTDNDRIFRDVSDTAIWMAHYRARETARPDALFRDPLASRFLEARGAQIATTLKKQDRNAWAYVTRELLFDDFVTREVAAGADLVLNLAAGLDTRPYRMQLPPSLRWVEVDLPPLMEWKAKVLSDATPACQLERVSLDLSDASARRELFARLGAQAKRVVVLTQGLLIYLGDEGVAALASDLKSQVPFVRWVTDIASPGLRDMMNKEVGKHLAAAAAPLKFAPSNGPRFLEAHGWRVLEVKSMLANAPRLPLLLRLFKVFPEGPWDRQGKRPWSAVCLLGRSDS